MAGMDLSFKRNARGISVFWMILAVAAVVVVLIAAAIAFTERAAVESEADPELVTPLGDPEAEVGDAGAVARESVAEEADFTTEPQVDVMPMGGELVEDVPTAADIDIVVDPDDGFGEEPDGGAAPFFPTPSGPEGTDGNPITPDL